MQQSNQYETYLRYVYENGRQKKDRTGTGTRSVFGYQSRYDLSNNTLPLVTTKFVSFKSIFVELLWFLRGDTNVKFLQDNGVTIWNEWADAKGSIGPGYGAQWRKWHGQPYMCSAEDAPPRAHLAIPPEDTGGPYGVYQQEIDQMKEALHKLRTNPDDRRIIVSAWNVADIPYMKLPPCHAFFQFYTEELTLEERLDHYLATSTVEQRKQPCAGRKGPELEKILTDGNVPTRRLSCQLYQRSVDSFLGKVYNVASYALLTHMVAKEVNMVAGEFVWTGGDCHVYDNHVKQVELQLSREPFPYPQITFNRDCSLFDYQPGDISLVNYVHHPAISAPVAV